MNKILLSIVIPTKDRYFYLKKIVKLIDSFKSDDIEIVIQDNTQDNLEFLKFLNQKEYPSLRYAHQEEHISVIHNSDLAILNSSGEYVCYIGDDDGVMPYIIDIVKWMKQNNYNVLKSNKPRYIWPGQQENYIDKDVSGILKFRKFNNKIKILSTASGLMKVLKKGGTSMDYLPCLYHGIIKRSVLNEIYSKCNTFFPGPSPDMANAVILSKIVNNFVYLDCPVVISGKSPNSTSGLGILHKHVENIENVKHLPDNTIKDWSLNIPKYWTGPTIWAESVIKALKFIEDHKSLNKFNFSYLYAFLFVFNFKQRKILFSDFKFNINYMSFTINIVRNILNRIKVFIQNRSLLTYVKIREIKDIEAAIEYLQTNTKKIFD